MLIALLKGKLSSEQQNMEDLLTSNVFGVLKHYPPKQALLPFVREARTLDGRQPLADLPDETRVDYEFWPLWRAADGRYCEPDVVLHLEVSDESRRLVVIEAKFHSGKSESDESAQYGEAARDQLAREWRCAVTEAASSHAEPILVYLTAHYTVPTDDVEVTLASLQPVGTTAPPISWLSWRTMTKVLSSTPHGQLRELHDSLVRLGLTFFEGFPVVRPVSRIGWMFARAWSWTTPRIDGIRWRFT